MTICQLAPLVTTMQATVAHEIAHAFLRHREGDPTECEVEAARLAQQWGFTGPAADPDYARWLWKEGADEA